MRLKKLSILSKSSSSISRLATVLFAACQRWSYHDTCRGISKKPTTRRIPIPENIIVVGGNTLRSMLWHRRVTRVVAVTHQANALAKGGRERVEDIHGWIEPLSESLIAALGLVQFIGFHFKYGEDGLRRGAGIDLGSEWVGSQVFSGLPLILFQCLFEYCLEVSG